MKKFYLTLGYLAVTAIVYAQQQVRITAQNVGISPSGLTPNSGAGLDINYTNKGLLIPRVSLSSLTSYSPIVGTPTTSMLVYNTNNALGVGYYYWDGSRWVRFVGQGGGTSNAWLTTGNAGTIPGTNFIGTMDNQALEFRTNNTERMRIANNGNVGIGTANPLEQLHVSGGNVVIANTTQNNFSQNRTSQVLYLDNIRAWSDNGVRLYDGNSNAHMLLSVGSTGRIQVFSPQSLSPGQLGTSWLEYADNTNFSHLVLNPLGGNVGIGLWNPIEKLHVAYGDVRIGERDTTVVTFPGPGYSRFLYFSGGPTYGNFPDNNDAVWIARYHLAPNQTELRINVGDAGPGSQDAVNVVASGGTTSLLYVRADGNVGIGTTAPNSPLTVVGNSLFGVNNPANVGAVQITTGGASPISNRLTYGTDGGGWKFAIGKNQGGTVTDQLTIQDNGDVGIGTTSPSNRLTVVGIPNQRATVIGDAGIGTNFAGLSVQGTLTPNNYSLLGDGANLYINRPVNGLMVFRMNNADQMVLTSAGNVGIGTSIPLARLHVFNGNVVIANTTQNNFSQNRTSQVLYLDNIKSWSDNGVRLYDGNSNSHFLFSATTVGMIQTYSPSSLSPGQLGPAMPEYSDNTNFMDLALNPLGGKVGIGTFFPLGQFELSLDQGRKPLTNTWTIVSDERLKDIHGPYSKGLNEILKLNPITYNYKNVGERTFAPEVLKTTAVGFSAQEVQKVFPEAVGVDADGYLNFNMHAILVAFVNAIKEQQAIIQAQKSEIDAIKSRLRGDLVNPKEINPNN